MAEIQSRSSSRNCFPLFSVLLDCMRRSVYEKGTLITKQAFGLNCHPLEEAEFLQGLRGFKWSSQFTSLWGCLLLARARKYRKPLPREGGKRGREDIHAPTSFSKASSSLAHTARHFPGRQARCGWGRPCCSRRGADEELYSVHLLDLAKGLSAKAKGRIFRTLFRVNSRAFQQSARPVCSAVPLLFCPEHQHSLERSAWSPKHTGSLCEPGRLGSHTVINNRSTNKLLF